MRSTPLQSSLPFVYEPCLFANTNVKLCIGYNKLIIKEHYLPTNMMLADIFTKGLPTYQHSFLQSHIGVIDNLDQGEVLNNDPNTPTAQTPKECFTLKLCICLGNT
jgi:hypothetical protein